MLDVFFSNLPYFMKGAVQTVWLALAGVGFGTIFGLILGVANASIGGLIAKFINVYVFLIRGIPVLVWMFLAYYMLPQLGLIIGDLFAVIGSLILYTGAFVSEIARGAVLSVPKHQI
ncbi:MAG: ABC transporter permease subunit, partial [Bacteroidetes bacterium]|nr:ABC transporter permease subunit [Bacteroidota bacterium]